MPLPPKLSPEEISSLLDRVDSETQWAQDELERALPLVEAAGLTVHSSLLDSSFGPDRAPHNNIHPPLFSPCASSVDVSNAHLEHQAALALQARQTINPLRGTFSAYPFVLSTTGGHSNTDHVVRQNPDGTLHKLSEYKRRYRRRIRRSRCEERGSDRWDAPRIPGGRRRRIRRDADAPTAPPVPPDSGYVVYVSQMTTKMRHDHPHRRHDQISAVKRISVMWNGLSDEERGHYVAMAKEAKEEYEKQLREYRATGGYRPLRSMLRLGNGNGPWVRMPYERKNDLEKEIDTYEEVVFPPRPKEMEEEHRRRVEESKERRRKKIKEQGLKYFKW